jgi:hypothetical protein
MCQFTRALSTLAVPAKSAKSAKSAMGVDLRHEASDDSPGRRTATAR